MSTGPLRVALTTLGCKVNFAEMADLAGTLAAAGVDVVPEHEPADVRVLNSCTVTMQADATTRQRIRRLRRQDPMSHLVVTGCSVDANPDTYSDAHRMAAAGVDAVFSNARKDEIAEHILSLSEGRQPRAARPAARSRSFIKVQDGCDHRCTYCIVWQARGVSRSVPPELVQGHVDAAIADGHREIVLCGVDLGSYGRDIGLRLQDLVARILDRLPDGTRLRLSSVNANDVTPGLAELNAHPQLCPHWHLPLQSGSDTMLRAMHRGYRRRQYLRVVDSLRRADARTEFTTDVMVGFPGETDADHEQTLSLVAEVGFLACHVFRWSPRPGTPASQLAARVPDAIARRRSGEVRRAASDAAARSLSHAVGRHHDAVWDHVGDGAAHGVAATYHEVLLQSPPASVRPGVMHRVIANGIDSGALRCTLAAQ
jgi:threonylcarbamoyladenosine tRNA methylthiotransferase MtaB